MDRSGPPFCRACRQRPQLSRPGPSSDGAHTPVSKPWPPTAPSATRRSSSFDPLASCPGRRVRGVHPHRLPDGARPHRSTTERAHRAELAAKNATIAHQWYEITDLRRRLAQNEVMPTAYVSPLEVLIGGHCPRQPYPTRRPPARQIQRGPPTFQWVAAPPPLDSLGLRRFDHRRHTANFGTDPRQRPLPGIDASWSQDHSDWAA